MGAVPLLLKIAQIGWRTKGPSTWYSVAIFMSHSPWRTPIFTSTFASRIYKGWLIFRETILNTGYKHYTLPSASVWTPTPTEFCPLLSAIFSVFICYFFIGLELIEITEIILKPLGVDLELFFKNGQYTPSLAHGSMGNAKNLLSQEEESPVLKVLR